MWGMVCSMMGGREIQMTLETLLLPLTEVNHYVKSNLLLFSYLVTFNSFTVLWTVACRAPLSVGFSWQEHWSR